MSTKGIKCWSEVTDFTLDSLEFFMEIVGNDFSTEMLDLFGDGFMECIIFSQDWLILTVEFIFIFFGFVAS